MTTKRQKAEKVEGRVKRRIELSKEILKDIGIPPEVYQRVVLNALLIAPGLVDCDEASLDQAIMRSINARLLPDGREGVIVPYKGKAQFMPMIDGQVKLALAATKGLTLRPRLVYEDDEWEYSEGLFPTLRHTPNAKGSRKTDDIIAAYVIAQVPGATAPLFEVMLRGDIDWHMGYSQNGREGKGPWASHYGEMAKKTVLRQILRRLPQPSGFAPIMDEDMPDLSQVEIGGYEEMPHPPMDDVVEEELVEDMPAEEAPARKPNPRRSKASQEADQPEAEEELVEEMPAEEGVQSRSPF